MFEMDNKTAMKIGFFMMLIEAFGFFVFLFFGGKNNGFWVLFCGLGFVAWFVIVLFCYHEMRFEKIENRINSMEARLRLMNEKRRK